MPSDLRDTVPWKITSSILWPRSSLGLCSPSAQRTASATLDLPQPLGPTMHVTPGKMSKGVLSANDLKPWTRMLWSLMIRAARSRRWLLISYEVAWSQEKNPRAGGTTYLLALNVGGWAITQAVFNRQHFLYFF